MRGVLGVHMGRWGPDRLHSRQTSETARHEKTVTKVRWYDDTKCATCIDAELLT